MGDFINVHKNGTSLNLNSRQNISGVTKAVQTVELLGVDVVDITVESSVKLSFLIGDKIMVVGRDYTLNCPPTERKLSEKHFMYDIQYEGVQYDLLRAAYSVNVDTTSNEIQDLSGDTLTGDLKRFMDVLISNANRVFPGKWVLGSCPTGTETLTETFSDSDNCLSVLQSLLSEGKYNTEFSIETDANGVRTLNIGASGNTHAYTFEYGKGKGIYNLTRQKISSSNIVTRLYVYGGSRNINTSKYKLQDGITFRGSKLCLPTKAKGGSYLESSTGIAKYGIWEQTKNFDDIYPHRTGTINGLGSSVFEFVDSNMFDLNALENDGVTTKYLIPGSKPKIHFNTGNLAGYEFEASFDFAAKKFTLQPFTDENGYTFPSTSSSAFQFAVGDTYVITDIYLPQSYIDTAESQLLAKGQDFLAKYSQPKISYSLNVDSFFLKNIVGAEVESNILWVGDYLPIKDADLDVDKTIRIKGFSRDLLSNGYSYNLTISDLSISSKIITNVISDLKGIDKVVKTNNLADPSRARRNWKAASEIITMVESLQAEIALIGNDPSSQYGLIDSVIKCNYNGNANNLYISASVIQHYVYPEGNPGTWNISALNASSLTSATPYYVYVKASKTDNSAVYYLSSTKIGVEEVAGYYHFAYGILSSVIDDSRMFQTTKGYTLISGDMIKTGKIVSYDGNSYFDLNTGEFKGVFKFTNDELVEDSINNITQTKIDGGIVTTGRVEVGSGALGEANAGITGNGTIPASVRMWAGSTYANRNSAPFRVLQDGKLYATGATISGLITAEQGTIGNWEITSGGIFNDSDDAWIIARKSDDIATCEARIGSNVISAAAGVNCPAWFMNELENAGGKNISMILTANNALYNYALLGNGNIALNRGDILTTKKNTMYLYSGSVNVISVGNGLKVCVINDTGTLSLYLPSKASLLDQTLHPGVVTCISYTNQSSLTTTQYQVKKGHKLSIGDAIRYGASSYKTIQEITYSTYYDTIKLDATLGVAIAANGTFSTFPEFAIELLITIDPLSSYLTQVLPNGSTWYNNDGATLTSVDMRKGDVMRVLCYSELTTMKYLLTEYKTGV